MKNLMPAGHSVLDSDSKVGAVAVKKEWWRGERGEWYVVAQAFLFLLLILGPRTAWGLPDWSYPASLIASVAGAALLIAGALLSAAAALSLGSNLTPVPRPKENATLVKSGPYKLVRHPIYSGLILAAFGWALAVNGWLTFLYALIIFVFFDIKSRREEKWLVAKFAGYPDYQKEVRKLIPWLW